MRRMFLCVPLRRRAVGLAVLVTASQVNAGRVEDLLGRDSVRRSVVRGAQIVDELDARWDQLSYKLRRTKPQMQRPTKPLDVAFAADVRAAADAAAAKLAKMDVNELRALVADERSIFRSVFDDDFALDTYSAFRVYNRLIDGAQFEKEYGKRLLDLFGGATVANVHERPQTVVDEVTRLIKILEQRGLASSVTVDTPDLDELASRPWGDKAADPVDSAPLQISATLYDPPELKARIVLETQSRRLKLSFLPDVSTTVLRAYLAQCCDAPLTIETYFVDTEYRTAFDKDNYNALQLEILLP